MEQILTNVFLALWGVPFMPQVVIVAVILFFVQVAKKKGLPKYLAPILSIVIAVCLCVLNAYLIGTMISKAISDGIIFGLMASGAFSNLQALGKGKENINSTNLNIDQSDLISTDPFDSLYKKEKKEGL